jgi:hypothetical protein
MEMTNITLIINFGAVIFAGVSVLLVWNQIKKNQKWNRKK